MYQIFSIWLGFSGHSLLSTNVTEQGLTLLSERNMLLSLWYSDSTLNAFFKISSYKRYRKIYGSREMVYFPERDSIYKNFRARIYSSSCFIPSRP